jgi:hypothetical protein
MNCHGVLERIREEAVVAYFKVLCQQSNVVPEILKTDPDFIAKIFEPLLKEIWELEELPNK